MRYVSGYFALVIAVVGVARWSALMDCFLKVSSPVIPAIRRMDKGECSAHVYPDFILCHFLLFISHLPSSFTYQAGIDS
jgi:hypothetical protein